MHSGMFSHGLELVIGVGGVRTQHPGLRDFPFMAAEGYQPPLFDYQEKKAAVPSAAAGESGNSYVPSSQR